MSLNASRNMNIGIGADVEPTRQTLGIQLLSDLHLEVHPHFAPTPAPGADVLVLAGDVGSYQTNSQLKEDDFGLTRFSPRHGWPTPVLYVPGNHEYDMRDFDATHQRLRELCHQLGITWLERETILLADLLGDSSTRSLDTVPAVRFVGTTLWTDFDALGPTESQAAAAPNALAAQLKARSKAFGAANYYVAMRPCWPSKSAPRA
jgi:Calcineurin-like phosphoesterase